MSDDRLSIGKVAAQTGCNIETIRFYEKESLLPQPGRTEGGHRLYTTEMVQRLVFIRRSRELGFSMNEIRQLVIDQYGEDAAKSLQALAELALFVGCWVTYDVTGWRLQRRDQRIGCS